MCIYVERAVQFEIWPKFLILFRLRLLIAWLNAELQTPLLLSLGSRSRGVVEVYRGEGWSGVYS